MTRIEVRDFGPIAEGSVDLKPLTVFIGPNNSGKSYMSLLVYALSRVGAGSETPGQLRENIERAITSGILSEELLDSKANRDAGSRVAQLGDELRRCFGADIRELVRSGENGPEGFSVAVSLEELDLRWEVRPTERELEQVGWDEAIDKFRWLLKERGDNDEQISYLGEVAESFIFLDLWRCHYLPASRTGILLGHRVLASLIVGQASLAWVRPVEIPRLTGTVTDLIQGILLLRPSNETGGLRAVAEFIERKITQGVIDVDMRAEYPEIYFEDETGRYRLNQVSSTVSEMAPLVLYLKYVVEPGERLIIEEPEAHLDAGKQRWLARAIARMVNAGVDVLVTTHSDYLLSQINNLLLASGVDADYTKDYDTNELLAPEQVGAYFFNPEKGATLIEEIEVTREDGISVDWFSRIYETLYDEAIRLRYAGT